MDAHRQPTTGRPQTRAQVLAIQPGRLSAKTRRRVDSIKALLAEIAALWDEADSAVAFECDVLRDLIDRDLQAAIDGGLEQLREPMPE